MKITWDGGSATKESNSTNCETLFQFDKTWEGSSVDESQLTVVFTAVVDGEDNLKWTLGVNGPVPVTPGETKLTEISETVTGFPESCTYDNSLVSELTAPTDEKEYVRNNSDQYVVTLPVTNTVTCDEEKDEDEGEVLADVDEPQVTVTPVGAADAGAGNTIVLGLAGSTAIVALGAAVRRFTV